MFDLNLKNYGYLELIICIGLNVLGLIFIQESNRLMSQLSISIVSVIFCITISLLNLKKALDRYSIFMIISVASLLLLRLIGTAYGRNSIRWITIPIVNSQLQPTEFVKLFLILFMSKYIDKMDNFINRFSNLVKVVSVFLIPFIIILIQPNLSSSLILLFIFIAMLFGSKLKLRWFVISFGIGFLLYFIVSFAAKSGYIYSFPFLRDYQKQRIVSFFSPTKGDQAAYQQENSLIAIGSGKLTGKGINNDSSQSVKNGNWLAEADNDFIFAVIGEEIGFIGATLIVLLYVFLIIDCLMIGTRQREQYKKLICIGVAAWLGFQSFVNMAVAVSLIPNTGIPLPFFSQGGSSLLSIYMGMGFVLNVKRDMR